ncbi:MAG: OmpH family outer membrane protein [Planctomycetes bacterium]|nr:OmpH family outer membrane protein [Planctomycetota bacterium]
MKTILYFATVVAVLLSLGFVTQSTYGQAVGTRVAVIDVPYIFKNYTGFKAEVEKVQQDINTFRRWVAEEQKKIRDETKKLELYKTGSAEYKQTEEEIARMQMNHRLEGAKKEREFMEREAKLYYDLYKRIEAAVADFALRNQIGLVLRFSGEDIDPTDRKSIMLGVNRPVVYQSRLDITDIILKKYIETSFQANPDPIPVTGRTGPQIPPRQY